ncbi:hypothetical protein LUZ60_014818 [Juncus effusus]|nr:hypothetical protein LUZ60_014818 [Juncus effusus]
MPLPAAAAAASSAASATHLRRQPLLASPSPNHVSFRKIPSFIPIQRPISCHARINNNASPQPSFSEKIGSKIRVKVPIKVYHVAKLPGLDLNGMIGTVKQYAGVWKGRKITPNLPFKVEFFAQNDGQSAPIKFFAHLREGEFEYLMSDADQ